MVAEEQEFEFHAFLTELESGLETIHRSLADLRRAVGRRNDRALLLFEIALGEIGGNVLTHGRPVGSDHQIEYELTYDGEAIEASFTDSGPAAHEHLSREMPGHESEDGRGLVLARTALDELGYEREGNLNRWRLVKRL